MLPQLLILSLVLAPNLVAGALFPKNSLVKMIGHKEFKAAMKENATSIVAFVAPWCGHCQKMAPEYSKAALGLHPLIPFYAVDCDDAKNKRLCADQGVKGFPTVKLFPRGNQKPAIEFNEPQRSASEFYYFAQRGVPNKIKKVRYYEDMDIVNDKNILNKHRALLMRKSNKQPLLWSVLANKYGDEIDFFSHRDRRGKSSEKMGFEAGGDEPKVLIFPAGETKPVQFMGILKHDSLSNFFDSLLDGSADLDELNAAAAAEEFVPDEKELEIERQQEAERLKLAHGGFADMADFEKAVREGGAKDFHGKHGYPGMMAGSVPSGHGKKDKAEESSSSSSSSTKSKKIRMPMTDEAGQVVLDVPSATATPTSTESKAPVESANSVSSQETATESESEPVSEREAEPEAEAGVKEAEPEAASVVAEEKVETEESAAVPEPPVEPSAEAEEDHVKDEL